MKSSLIAIRIFVCSVLILFVVSCGQFINPGNFTEYFKSMKIASYKSDKIALLPILPDDTTASGAFYSTNHFYNYLMEKYTDKTFADIDWMQRFRLFIY